jgi:hypothetical protein
MTTLVPGKESLLFSRPSALRVQIAVLLAALGLSCSPRVSTQGEAASFGEWQERIKATQPWPGNVDLRREIQLQPLGIMAALNAPAGLEMKGPGIVQVLDNMTGMVIARDLVRATDTTIDTRLSHPTAFAEGGGLLWIAAAWGLSGLSHQGTVVETIRSPYGIRSLFRLADGSFLLNSTSRIAGDAVVRRMRPDGEEVSRWGAVADRSAPVGAAPLLGRGSIAVCGDWVVLVRQFSPIVEWFPLNGGRSITASLPIPGEQEFSEYVHHPTLVHPTPGYFQFPSYALAVRCVGDKAYVLLDMPRPSIAVMNVTGSQVVLTEATPDTAPAMRWSGLAVTATGGRLRFFTLGRHVDTGTWELFAVSISTSEANRKESQRQRGP